MFHPFSSCAAVSLEKPCTGGGWVGGEQLVRGQPLLSIRRGQFGYVQKPSRVASEARRSANCGCVRSCGCTTWLWLWCGCSGGYDCDYDGTYDRVRDCDYVCDRDLKMS